MKLSSFRLRIAFSSAMLASSTLIGFGICSWWLTYNAKVSRLDAVLESKLLSPPIQNIGQWEQISLPPGLETDTQMPMVLLAIDPQGQTIYRSNNWPSNINLTDLWSKFPQPPPNQLNQLPPPPIDDPPPPNFRPDRVPPKPRFVNVQTKTGNWRIGLVILPHAQIAIAVNLNIINQEMSVISNIFLISIPLSLLLVAVGAWILSGRALKPIQQLTVAIQKVTVNGLNKKVPLNVTDVEFLELIEVFNQMLERLDRSFKQASRFSGDAAHELKTPLAILQGELERTLQQVETGSEIQERLGNLLDEVHRLSGIVRKLLLLSLADAGKMRLYRVEVDLSAILTEMLEDIELLAPDLDVQTSIDLGLRVHGDQDLLTQVWQNLLSNAIKYNLPQGWIKIYARPQGKNVLITIINASENLPKSDRQRIFDRFYRGDPSRNRKVEGTGLGLSLAREIAIAHGGQLILNHTPPGQTSFSLSLPKL